MRTRAVESRPRALSLRSAAVAARYTNQSLSAAQVIAELVAMAREVSADANRARRSFPRSATTNSRSTTRSRRTSQPSTRWVLASWPTSPATWSSRCAATSPLTGSPATMSAPSSAPSSSVCWPGMATRPTPRPLPPNWSCSSWKPSPRNGHPRWGDSTVVRRGDLYRLLYSFTMTMLQNPHEVSVTEATQRGVARLVADAEEGSDLVLTRWHRPVAAVVSMGRLAELEEAAADLRDLALVLGRVVTDTGRRTSLDDVLEAFGHTRESLDAVPDDE